MLIGKPAFCSSVCNFYYVTSETFNLEVFLLFWLTATGSILVQGEMLSSGYRWYRVGTASGRCAPSAQFALLYLQSISVLMEVLIRPQPYSHPLKGLSLLLSVRITLVMAALWDALHPPPSPPSPFFSASSSPLCKQGNHSSHYHSVPLSGSRPFLPINNIWL